MKKNLNDRIATSPRKLSLNKETLKRLTGEDLSRIAGGRPPPQTTIDNGCPMNTDLC
jgi:hypothetical protein